MSVPSWVADAVFYQLFPDRFARSERVRAPGPLEPWDDAPTRHGFKGGNLPGAEERLDHLESLGVNAIYLNPIFASASNHRYHTYDYLAVDPLLGGTEAFRSYLDAAHRRGMRVVLDGVFNHSGRGFWPFHHVLEAGATSPYAAWFHLDRERLAAGRPLDPYPQAVEQAEAGAGSGDRSLRALGYRAWWDLPALPKLNVDDPEARAFLHGVIETWTRFGIDGWRFDVPEEVAPDFWSDARDVVARINPDAYLVGEIWRLAPEWVGSGPFHGLMNYPLAWAILGFAGAGSIDRAVAEQQQNVRRQLRPLDAAAFVERIAEIDRAYRAGTTVHLNLLGSHDTPRILSLLGGDAAAVRLAMLLLFSLPGAPCIYYGDEVGLAGGGDPLCRGAFPWNAARWDHQTLRAVMDLTAARRRHPALRTGPTTVLGSVGDTAVVRLGGERDGIVLAVNAGESPATIELPRETLGAGAVDAVAGVGAAISVARRPDGHVALSVPARSGALLALEAMRR
jgi:neopullulanase